MKKSGTRTSFSRNKPIYKKILRLRENVQNRKKLLNFKKNKWKKIQNQIKKGLKWYKKFKAKDQMQYKVTKYPNKGTSYQKNFRNTLNSAKKFNLFYGGMLKRKLKEKITASYKNRNNKYEFLKYFESRLDIVLYRAKFVVSIVQARQLILHDKVFVNKNLVKSKSYVLKPGDLISIDLKSSKLIEANTDHYYLEDFLWPIPPKHLLINYKTLQIIFGELENSNFLANAPIYLNLEDILLNYQKH
jgi:ribosomal protein S4